MLELTIPKQEFYDEKNNLFIDMPEVTLVLEHSLVSLSKWEAIHKKAFLTTKDKTREETISYFKCMTITRNVPDQTYTRFTGSIFEQITNYIQDTQTATYLPSLPEGGARREPVTSELIYYWMTALQIPFEPCERWHLSRLMTLIGVCNIKNQPPKKQRQYQRAADMARINEERKQKYGTAG